MALFRKRSTTSQVSLHDRMLPLVGSFVDGAAAEGWSFSVGTASAARLDEFADWLLEENPDPEGTLQNVALAMGAFLGEVIVVSAGGVWEEGPHGEPGIRLLTGLHCFPVNKVQKRLFVGPEHSLVQFLDVAVTGVLPADARRMPPP